jgi:hypothetical protein
LQICWSSVRILNSCGRWGVGVLGLFGDCCVWRCLVASCFTYSVHPEKFAGCAPLQFIQEGGSVGGFLHSSVECCCRHLTHLAGRPQYRDECPYCWQRKHCCRGRLALYRSHRTLRWQTEFILYMSGILQITKLQTLFAVQETTSYIDHRSFIFISSLEVWPGLPPVLPSSSIPSRTGGSCKREYKIMYILKQSVYNINKLMWQLWHLSYLDSQGQP